MLPVTFSVLNYRLLNSSLANLGPMGMSPNIGMEKTLMVNITKALRQKRKLKTK